MNNNDEIIGAGKSGEEDLLDFEFDDLSPEDFEAESSDSLSDEDIIDLVDIVEPGELSGSSETDEMSQLMDDDIFADEGATNDFSDMSLDELAKSVELELSETLRKNLDTTLDGLETSEQDDAAEVEEAVAPEQFEPEAEGLDSLAVEKNLNLRQPLKSLWMSLQRLWRLTLLGVLRRRRRSLLKGRGNQ